MSGVHALEVLELEGQIFVGRQDLADPHKGFLPPKSIFS